MGVLLPVLCLLVGLLAIAVAISARLAEARQLRGRFLRWNQVGAPLQGAVAVMSIRTKRRKATPWMGSVARVLRFNPHIPEENVIAPPVVLLIGVVLGLATGWLAADVMGPKMSAALGMAAGFFGTRAIFTWQHARYCQALFLQIPESLSLMVRSLQVGRPLTDAVRSLAIESQSPTKEEFGRVVGDIAIGRPVDIAIMTLFIGTKVALLALLPLGVILMAWLSDMGAATSLMWLSAAIILAVLIPNWILRFIRNPFQDSLRKGLPDALDLMVVAAEAGLGLESAVERVSHEMERINRAIALEFGILVQELRIMPDRGAALDRMAERTGLPSFKRLATTLSQTLRYGTPLAQSLRVLSAEMRLDRQMHLEEKAIRLPTLLVLPLVVFILPTLFITLLTPSVMEISAKFGGQ